MILCTRHLIYTLLVHNRLLLSVCHLFHTLVFDFHLITERQIFTSGIFRPGFNSLLYGFFSHSDMFAAGRVLFDLCTRRQPVS